MRYTKCPGIEKDWSLITLGCWQLAPSIGWGDTCPPQEADTVVKAALDSGITAFDTAEGYGDGESERRLAKALGSKKDDVIIISKLWPDAELTLSAYRERLDGTLKALNRDYVDVYLIHWPGDYFNSPEKSAKLVDYMTSFKDSGKAKVIGLSNFHKVDIELLGNAISNFSINQVPYNLLQRHYEGETLKTCQAHNIQYMAYSPTAKGALARPLSKEDLQETARHNEAYCNQPLYTETLKVFETVKSVAKELNCTPIQVTLAWVLAQQNILTAIVGSRKHQQVSEAAAGTNVKLEAEHLSRLTQASNAFLQANAASSN